MWSNKWFDYWIEHECWDNKFTMTWDSGEKFFSENNDLNRKLFRSTVNNYKIKREREKEEKKLIWIHE